MATQHKAEVMRALEQMRDRLKGTEPIEGHARFQLAASAEYALGELALVQEVKRVRRASVDGAAPETQP